MIDATTCAARRERLRQALHTLKLDAMLVSLDANRYYLSGFEAHDPQINESAGHLLVLANGEDWLYTDARYLDAARRLWNADHVFIYRGTAFAEMGAHLAGLGCGRVGFEAGILTLDAFERLRDAASGVDWVRADGQTEALRRVKDADEIARLRQACELNHVLMEALPDWLEPGVTEADLAWQIERFFRENGASGLAFPSIVGYGPNAALPHYTPSETVRLTEETCVLVDVGCRLDDYCSDQTRTFWVGERPTDAFRRTMDAVRGAQQTALEAMRPGMPVCEAYRLAHAHFEALGVDAFFTHSLGHGIGLQTHEAPSLNSRNETPLVPGMVVTVEPGLYYPAWGGVRWEYMALVTEDGVDIL